MKLLWLLPLASSLLWLSGCEAPADQSASTKQPSSPQVSERAADEPGADPEPAAHEDAAESGPGCASCGETQTHTLPEITQRELAEQLEKYASEPLQAGSPALETLLFHNERAREYLTAVGAPELDAEHRAFLVAQLARDHVLVAIRIIDEEGIERLTLEPTRVPLRHREHLRSTRTVDLQPAEASGTVVRVGLDRLWVRY